MLKGQHYDFVSGHCLDRREHVPRIKDHANIYNVTLYADYADVQAIMPYEGLGTLVRIKNTWHISLASFNNWQLHTRDIWQLPPTPQGTQP